MAQLGFRTVNEMVPAASAPWTPRHDHWKAHKWTCAQVLHDLGVRQPGPVLSSRTTGWTRHWTSN